MSKLRPLAGATFILGPALYLAAEAITAAAWKTPSYSYADNWISDLRSATAGEFQGRELDSPLHVVMNSGFIIQGILFGLISIVVGAFGLVSVVALFLTFDAGLPSGAIERGSVYTIVIWQLAVAAALLRGRAGSRAFGFSQTGASTSD